MLPNLSPNEIPTSSIFKYSFVHNCHYHCVSLLTALPLLGVSVTASSGQIVSGGRYSLTCIVQVVRFLANQPNVTWLGARGDPPLGNGITVGQPRRLNTTTTLRFTIDRLDQSHLGVYTCRACISIDMAAIQEHCNAITAEITLESE